MGQYFSRPLFPNIIGILYEYQIANKKCHILILVRDLATLLACYFKRPKQKCLRMISVYDL